MTMNTFGRLFRVTTWGESHGSAIGCVVDGCPSGLELKQEEIQAELDRRRPGQSSIVTPRAEEDRVEILSGIFEGRSLGSPISMLIQNRDVDSSKYEAIKDTPRPGHGDLTWREKFGHVDWRGGGRNSARETAARVAAGAVGKKLLQTAGISIIAHSKEIGGIKADGVEVNSNNIDEIKKKIESNPVRALDRADEMEKAILAAREDSDSVGGIVEAVALGVPPGLGEPLSHKLDAEIAAAMMGIPAVKGVEIGAGFELVKMKGSEANDEFIIDDDKVRTSTNNCGGILGGISNGMPIVIRVAIKPTSSIGKEQKTVNLATMEGATIMVGGRHDPCIVPRAVPVVEAMLALVLADHSLLAGTIAGTSGRIAP
ncbi:MAG: chorismate synthase [Candidatus Altiarchaeota archaeon]|nr:chorismate synthase [Candidatus Altiarchaeota archaeon]MBU4436750.1 chorismate synthase [Candidatus Altiarchaeota archaeon]